MPIMKKQMKFLICGFGNIAQRHFRNLKKLQPNCKINVYTTKKDKYRIFNNELNISFSNNLLKFYKIDNIFHNLDEALDAENYDAIIVCTLPPDRLTVATKSAKKGFNLFIEKPLSSKFDGKVADLVKSIKGKCAIGYQMRFHPVLQQVRKIVRQKKLGNIYRVEVIHGNSVNNWTKGRNLNNFYVLKEDQGGGVILSQIHEIDYIDWIFGNYYPKAVEGGNFLKKNYGVEDNISILGYTYFNNQHIPTTIHLDFISKIPTRKLMLYGDKNSAEVNIIEGTIYNLNTRETYFYKKDWNDLFTDEMEAFLKSLKIGKWQEPLACLQDGVISLEKALQIKEILEETC